MPLPLSPRARSPRRPAARDFRPRLRRALEDIATRYGPAYLDSDPVQIPRGYDRPEDREVAALVAASLAFGNVPAILASARRVLEVLGPSPAAGLRLLARDAPPRGLSGGPLAGISHRWVRGEDLLRFLVAAGRLLEEEGRLGDAMAREFRPDDPDVGPALASFVSRLRSLDPVPGSPRTRGMDTLLPTPAAGSACKRWNLLLRWCARPDDGVDLGLWPAVPTRSLLLPLDVHVSRLARKLRLTGRRTVDWKAAQLATATLRRFDPDDPVRFDFALCRLGILRIDGPFHGG